MAQYLIVDFRDGMFLSIYSSLILIPAINGIRFDFASSFDSSLMYAHIWVYVSCFHAFVGQLTRMFMDSYG